MSGKYGCDELFDQHPVLRLATFVVNRNEAFSFAVELCGHTYDFEQMEEENKGFGKETGKKADNKNPKSVDYSREVDPHDDIEDILSEKKKLTMPITQGIIPWLTTIHRGNRGFELGTFDPTILGSTMKKISNQWTDISLGYVSDAVTQVHKFVTALLSIVCPDDRMRAGLMSILMDGLLLRYKRAMDQVEFVLQVERHQNPATQNPSFSDQLTRS